MMWGRFLKRHHTRSRAGLEPARERANVSCAPEYKKPAHKDGEDADSDEDGQDDNQRGDQGGHHNAAKPCRLFS
jgi:hypothetical protein